MPKIATFASILKRAEKRKGGPKIVAKILPKMKSAKDLAKIRDDRILAEMTRRVFSAGFVWRVIDDKWDGFEKAFLGFKPGKLLIQPDEYWDKLLGDKRIVRNGQKIRAVRGNAEFVADIAREHGSFGKFIADWPDDDYVGLLEVLAKRGARLGGHSGQYLLRFLGKESFIASGDTLMCLRDAGLELSETASSKRDLRKIQAQFNIWSKETGRGLTHISRVCAMSVGENYDPAVLISNQEEQRAK